MGRSGETRTIRRPAAAVFAGASALVGLLSSSPALASAAPVRAFDSAPPLVTTQRPARTPYVQLSPGNSFQGLGPSETYGGVTVFNQPGEPSVAVGPSDVLETVNTAAAIYSKTGTKLQELDFGDCCWGGTSSSPISTTDPRTLYLPSGQFAFSASITTSGAPDPMVFAVSKTSDPTAGWYFYEAPNTTFLDQPKIEATSDKFIIAGNTSTTEVMYVYNLGDVESGVAHPAVTKVTATKSNVFQAATEQTATSNGYFVASFPGNVLYLATVSGTPKNADVKLTQTLVRSTDYPGPQNPSVPGGTYDGGDGRILDAVYEVETSDSKAVIQYSSTRSCGARDCLTDARIDLSGTKPVLTYDNLVGEPGWDYTYGAVGLDGAGDVFESYTRSSSTTTPEAAIVGPSFDVLLEPSASSGLTGCSGNPCERWGDYLATDIDPSDPTTVWVSGLYQTTDGGGNSTGYDWGTVIAHVSLSTYALPTVTTGAATKVTGTGAHISGTVNPNGVATTYHFDYGLTSGYDSSTTAISAGSGTATLNVAATLTGLQPGTTYHYRIVATTATGNAVGADHTFKTKPATITSVVFSGSSAAPTVTINGSNFGTEPAGSPAGCSTTGDTFGTRLWFQDTSQGWTAGQSGNCIGLIVSSYTNTQIVYTFGSGYSQFGTLPGGDAYTLSVQGVNVSGTVGYATITSVTFTGSSASPTVTVVGSNFGSEPQSWPAGCSSTGQNFGNELWINDATAGWTAGQGSNGGGDCIGLVVSTYSNTQIVYTFGSGYPGNLNARDSYTADVLGTNFSGTVAYS